MLFRSKEVAEKRTLLSILVNYTCPESIRIAESMAKDETVASEAKAALDRLSGGGRGPRRRGGPQ